MEIMDNSTSSDRINNVLMTRVSLVGRMRDQQNEFAWSEFVNRYRKYLYNYLIRMGIKSYDADDIVQISLVKIWNAMPMFDYQPNKGRFRAWLCTIAGNTAKNYLRRVKNSGNKSDLLEEEIFSELDNEDFLSLSVPPEVERIAEDEWLQYLPELALKQVKHHFDKRTIQVFLLCSKGVPTAEIARKMQISPSAVYVYKSRVAEKVADEVAKLKNEIF